ncbi:tetratricopeptide repeat protein [Pedobacter deserti]|uniref:tetratricopeptide repeat protein n=1 Tax=Pedobacter deserti TaxID=2817382 RepID=UPI00210F202A|nr:tetratricopeptide repeat protein [Pedobacter sp. SYSU D00382]
MKNLIVTLCIWMSSICCFAQQNTGEMQAYEHYHRGEFEEAARLFEQAFARSGNDQIYDFYVNALFKLKRLEEVERLTKKLLKQDAKNPHYRIALGRLQLEKGWAEAANRTFASVINDLPANELRIRELSNIFNSFQAYDQSVSTLLQGRKILNNPMAFHYELVSVYRFRKDKYMLIGEYLNVLEEEPELLPQAESVLSTVLSERSDFLTLQSALLKKLQKKPDAEALTQLLIWQYMQLQEYEMVLKQLIALDKRLNGDGTPVFHAASTFLGNKAYHTAIKAFEYLTAKGRENPYFIQARIGLIETKYELAVSGKFERKDILTLAAQYDTLINEFGKTAQTVFAMKKLANLQAHYVKDLKAAERTLEEALAVPQLRPLLLAEIKLDLGDIYVLTNQPWEAFLVYEQVSKQFEGQPVSSEARFRSARLSFYQGNFDYARSQADVLKASTSQLMANDALNLSLLISDNLQNPADSSALKMYADAKMLEFRNLRPQSLAKLDSIGKAFPQNSLADDILMAKSAIYISTGELRKAEEVLKALIGLGNQSIWADDALFTLAGLYEKDLQQPEQARLLYERLINDHPGSLLADEARKRFRKLRGDNIET